MATETFSSDGDAYLTEKRFCALVHINARTARRWRLSGDCPEFIRAGRNVLYSRADVDAWLARRKFKHSAAEVTGQALAA